MAISNRKPLTEVLAGIKTDLGIDSAYSHFINGAKTPYLIYIGTGQSQLLADGSAYWRDNTYQVELYYKVKDESLEAAIEGAFLAGGWNYSKGTDAYMADEGLFVIFYDLG